MFDNVVPLADAGPRKGGQRLNCSATWAGILSSGDSSGTFFAALHPMRAGGGGEMRSADTLKVNIGALGEEELVDLARGRNEAAVRALTQRFNQRLFRMARSVLGNDSEAE